MTLAGNTPESRRIARTAERLPGVTTVPTTAEVAWAAGIIEGEGTFYGRTRHRQGEGTERSLSVEVGMTDLDVLQRLQRVFGMGLVTGPRMRGNRKPVWRWRVWQKDHVDDVVTLIYPWLCTRRQFQCREAYLRCGRGLPFEERV